MINTFANAIQLDIYEEAIRLVGFSYIQLKLMEHINDREDLTKQQKLAIAIISKEIHNYPNSADNVHDGVLLAILNIGFNNIGFDDISALSDNQRINIFEALMSICKSIILAESDRLATVASSNSHLNYGYGYGTNGYGYGFDNLDFFQVF